MVGGLGAGDGLTFFVLSLVLVNSLQTAEHGGLGAGDELTFSVLQILVNPFCTILAAVRRSMGGLGVDDGLTFFVGSLVLVNSLQTAEHGGLGVRSFGGDTALTLHASRTLCLVIPTSLAHLLRDVGGGGKGWPPPVA